jgi:PAS domain S-box-containing protein
MYHVAVILTDAQKRILWVNEDFTHITGYSLSEVVGKKPGTVLQGPDSEPDVIMRIRKALENEVAFKDTIINYRKNGERYPCRLVIHPVHNEENELTNFIAFEVDGNTTPSDDDLPMMQLNERYHSSSLKGFDEVKLYGKLKSLVENQKLYLDPDLTLKQLAERLDTNTKYLSQVVNHFSGSNFQQFLNVYRINEFTSHLKNGHFRHLTLFGLAQQCGFNNKSTFFKVFKEVTGATPKVYIAGIE